MNTEAKIPKQFQCPLCGCRIMRPFNTNARQCEHLECLFLLQLVWIHPNPELIKPLYGNV